MTLLILTPTLGAHPLLRETIASIAVAAPGARHVLIAPAETVSAVQALAPAARVVAENDASKSADENAPARGMYAALNAGIRALAGDSDWDAITWINDDDRLCAPGFAHLLATLTKLATLPNAPTHTRARGEHAGARAVSTTRDRDFGPVGVAYGQVTLIDARGARLGALPVAHHADDLPALLARGIMPLAQPGTVITRAAWEKLGGLDASYRLAGDLDFFARALRAGIRFTFVDATVAEFRLRAGQLSKQAELAEQERVLALSTLGRVPPDPGALWRFRWQNRAVYTERVRRHGFVSMHRLYQQTA